MSTISGRCLLNLNELGFQGLDCLSHLGHQHSHKNNLFDNSPTHPCPEAFKLAGNHLHCWLLIAHNQIPKTLEQFALQRLAKKIRLHLVSGTPHDTDVSLVNLVGQEKIPNVQCTGPLARALLAILL